MKSLRFVLPIAIAALVAMPYVSRAEDSAPPPPKKERAAKAPKTLPGLTQEESTKVQAAKAAAEKDATVIQAKKDLEAAKTAAKDAPKGKDKKEAHAKVKEAQEKEETAVKAAMIKADPTVEPLVKKMEDARKAAAEARKGKGKGDKEPAK